MIKLAKTAIYRAILMLCPNCTQLQQPFLSDTITKLKYYNKKQNNKLEIIGNMNVESKYYITLPISILMN